MQSAFTAATSGGIRFSPLSAAARTRASASRAAVGVPLALHSPHAVGLPGLDLERDAQQVRRALLGHLVAVHADHRLLRRVDLLLVEVGRLGDLLLRVAELDRPHHAAQPSIRSM